MYVALAAVTLIPNTVAAAETLVLLPVPATLPIYDDVVCPPVVLEDNPKYAALLFKERRLLM
jgi:hypothetical protein